MLSDKDKLNQALATSYDELKIKLESMMDEHKNFSILSGKYETLKKKKMKAYGKRPTKLHPS